MSKKRVLKFEGIDSWNRPIFKNDNGNRFGDTATLFDYNAIESEVLDRITEHNLCYFGDHFDCEPMGTTINPDKIIIERNKSI